MSKISDEIHVWCDLYFGKVSFNDDCNRLHDIANRIDAEMVELPRDRDGVPIHVGDVLTDGEYTFRVDELAAFGDGSWSIRNEDGNAWAACDVTHHHEPTVEDVLREMADRCYADEDEPRDRDAIVAEYAAKLRLAGDDE